MPDLSTPTVGLNLVPERQFNMPRSDPSFVAAGAEGVGRAAADLNRLARAYVQVEQQKQNVLAQAQIQDESLRLRERTDEIIRNYQALKNKDAIDALPKVRRQLEQVANEVSSRATAFQPVVKDTIARNTRAILFEENSRASQHELDQTLSWRDETLKGLKQEAQDNALLYKNNPQLYAKYVNEYKDYTRQELDNAGIPENSDAWKAAMRDAESAIHEINIYDDIERESFGSARRKLDSSRRNMDQETWLRLDRMLIARQKAWADARAGRGKQSDTLLSYFNARKEEARTSEEEEFKKIREGIMEQVRSETVIDVLRRPDGTEYLDENGQIVYEYRPKTEEEIQADYQRRLEAYTEQYAQQATMDFKNQVDARTDFLKRNELFVNNEVVDYINQTKSTGRPPTVEEFRLTHSAAYNTLVGKHGGNVSAAQQELQQSLNAYYNFNPHSNAAVVAGFENFLETASASELQAMSTETFDMLYGSYMSPVERIENLTKLENKKRGISNGFVDDNAREIKNTLQGYFPDAVFNVQPKDYGDSDMIIQSEQGRWIYQYVASALRANPSLTANSNLRVAIANIVSDPTFLMEKFIHDQDIEDTRDEVQDFLESQGIDNEGAFVAWIVQNNENFTDNWSNLSTQDKQAIAGVYEAVFATKFDPSVFEGMKYSEVEIRNLMRDVSYGLTGVQLER